MDVMSAEGRDGRRVSVMTCGHRIVISTNTEIDGRPQRGSSREFTFDQFYEFVQRHSK